VLDITIQEQKGLAAQFFMPWRGRKKYFHFFIKNIWQLTICGYICLSIQ